MELWRPINVTRSWRKAGLNRGSRPRWGSLIEEFFYLTLPSLSSVEKS